MIRLTHRLCRSELASLAGETEQFETRNDELGKENEQLTQKNASLVDDLRAAEHALDEVEDACKDLEYATTEATIPEALRSRLIDASELPAVLNLLDEAKQTLATERDYVEQGLNRMLEAAHQDGRLARTLALMEGAGLVPREGLTSWLMRIHRISWTDLRSWACRDNMCPFSTREMVWHPDAPEKAHLSCECGRIWPAGWDAVERAEDEIQRHGWRWTKTQFKRRWSETSAASLEATDRALPTPAQIRDGELAA